MVPSDIFWFRFSSGVKSRCHWIAGIEINSTQFDQCGFIRRQFQDFGGKHMKAHQIVHAGNWFAGSLDDRLEAFLDALLGVKGGYIGQPLIIQEPFYRCKVLFCPGQLLLRHLIHCSVIPSSRISRLKELLESRSDCHSFRL